VPYKTTPKTKADLYLRLMAAHDAENALRLAYNRAARLPQLRKKIRATLKSAEGAVRHARAAARIP
jgi:hypothetical protein